jgi:DGQHR domain-containing protein
MNKQLTYSALFPEQTKKMPVFCFVARASEIEQFARIERASRSVSGSLHGFQRPQIANHIREIREYLQKSDAILPNPIVVAFSVGAWISNNERGLGKITIDVSAGPHGWIVDGQQRFSALQQLQDRDFEVFVSAFICTDEEELHKQFILINNTKPLPKSLIYELLPKVSDLPDRYSSRSMAAELVELLNFNDDSILKGMIKQQTNPGGVIIDTAMQKVIMNSLNDGALRLFYGQPDFKEKSFELLNNFFRAVAWVFRDAWVGHKPSSSRLVHGAGIMSMGYAMETLFSMRGARDAEVFAAGLEPLRDKVAWTSGYWHFADDDVRKWNSIQNLPRDIRQLSHYLVGLLKKNSQIELDTHAKTA